MSAEEMAMSELYAQGDNMSGGSEDGSGDDDDEEGSSESGSGSSSGSSGEEDEDESEGEEEEEDEPVLKYRRFAKEVVSSISLQGVEHMQIQIRCIAVHAKVREGSQQEAA